MARCIIVDDHGDTRTGYAEFLAAFGFDVRSAADAEELRAVLRDWVPDAIVLDLQLPRTDGWELTREIKADPAHASHRRRRRLGLRAAGRTRRRRRGGLRRLHQQALRSDGDRRRVAAPDGCRPAA